MRAVYALGAEASRAVVPASGAAPPTAELDPSAVAAQIRARLDGVKGCYVRGLATDARLAGKVTLHWTIEVDGHVSLVDVEEDTLADGEVATCIMGVVAGWRFAGRLAEPVEVSFPFVFKVD
jgi:hypothetical protein